MWELGAWEYLPVFALCALAATPIVPAARDALVRCFGGVPLTSDPRGTAALCDYEGSVWACLPEQHAGQRALFSLVLTLCDLALVALLVLSVCSIATGTFNPFIYFRF